MEQINVNQFALDTLDALGSVFINSPYISLLGKDCKTGVNASNLSTEICARAYE